MVEEQAAPPPSSAADHPSSDSQNTPQEIINKNTQLPASSSFTSPGEDLQKLYPSLAPGVFLQQHDPEHMNRGPGLYAVSVAPFNGSVAGFPSHTLIPFTYNVPTTPSSSESGAVGQDQGQGGQPQMQQPPGQQRQVVVRRFQIAIQIDVPLILKLAAVIFLFNQDGSRQKLALLIFFALIIYLYQTGALAPLVRWLSRGMQRAAAPPPQPPRPAVRADNPAAGRQGNEDAALADGLAGVGNDNQPPLNNENGAGANEQLGGAEGVQGGNRWWGIVKEVQMIVFGFITSLLPGFHHID
ncbi:hypothetical protein LIER_27988 [Lithospermum erythrorhizon]|uniref:Uncharacterized protein n=1 Tax=Lithospermum erythrorhizon TaxID=34254 RepID=A0AAV3RFL6_LITER